MKSRTKLFLANLVCILVIAGIWTLFITPIIVVLAAYIGYSNPKFDTSVNGTIAAVFDSEACKNHTLEEAITSIRKIAAGNFRTNFTCNPPYFSNGTQCIPGCLLWNPGGDLYYYLYRYSIPVLSCITTVAGIIGASTWLFLKRLWKFPHIISLYLLITVIGQSSMIFIGSLSPTNFYCTSIDLIKSRENPSIPCHIQGAIFQFFLLSFMLWYVCDLCNILYVLFPLKSDLLIIHRNKIHIFQSILSWGLPCIIVITIGATAGYEIVSAPAICLPPVFLTTSTLFIPGVAFSLLTQTIFTIICTILYKRHIRTTKVSTNNEYSQRLRHISVFSTSFSILIILVLIHFACLAIGREEVAEYLADYWHCLTVFDNNNECCRPAYIAHYYPFTGFLSNVSFCTWGIVAVSAVSVKEASSLWKRAFKRCFEKFKSTKPGRRERLETESLELECSGTLKHTS
ncbi:hypothetical protein LOD99_14128 [Oopsacas minuta]|uniref:G-protein coupled receptors family 2 profile 2 domain-containing protein n=1 Tax=Oopsacas minuta TaxID=111878 RepID=A0AAV7KK03_9METZ|nr:hypothetical protein LOD99_14128 [Oopsacas minuta]